MSGRLPSRHGAASLVFVFSGLVLASWPTAQAPAQTPPPRAGTALVSGRVLDAITSAPLDDAIVTIESNAIDGPAPFERRRQLTDGQGRFAFAGLPASRVRVTVDRSGYMPGEYRRRSPESSGAPLDVAEGQQITNADVSMWKYASITGRVLDEAGEPMVGVEVNVLRRGIAPAGFARLSQPEGRPYSRTDDRGTYRFGTLRPGQYVVVVPSKIATVPVGVWTSGALRGDASGAIGETAPLGNPRNIRIGDHVVAILNSAPVPPAPAKDGMLPAYRSTFHPSAVASQDAETVTVGAGEDRTGIDVQLRPVQTSRVSGQITGPEGPLASTSLRLVPAGAVADDLSDPAAASAITDADGRFLMLAVPHGQYVLRVLTQSVPTTGRPAGSKPALWIEESVTVNQAEVRNLSYVARPVPKIQGRIEFAGGRSVPPEAITLIISSEDPGPNRTVNPRVEKDNMFAAELRPGWYTVIAVAGSGMWCTSTVAADRNINDEPVEIRDRDLTGVVVSCGAEPSRLSGTVRDERGVADRGARVVFFSADRRHWAGATARPGRFGQSGTTDTGSYALTNLIPGDYFVAAVSGPGATLWRDPRVLETLSRQASRVTIVAGESRSQDLRTVVLR